MGPECYSPYYLDYDWARWAEPAYNVPSLDMNWYISHSLASDNSDAYFRDILMITETFINSYFCCYVYTANFRFSITINYTSLYTVSGPGKIGHHSLLGITLKKT